MRRLLVCLLVVTATFSAPAGMKAAQDAACQEIAAYFALVDDVINEGMVALAEQPGFQDAFASGIETSAAGNSGFLALSPEEQEAVIAYLRMPGEALGVMDAGSVPDEARDLHDSAIGYWTLIPDMMQAIAEESPSAALPYLADLDTLSAQNIEAQGAVMAACPDEVETWADAYKDLSATASGTPVAELMILRNPHKNADAEGLGYPVLFFAADDETATPAAFNPPLGGRPV